MNVPRAAEIRSGNPSAPPRGSENWLSVPVLDQKNDTLCLELMDWSIFREGIAVTLCPAWEANVLFVRRLWLPAAGIMLRIFRVVGSKRFKGTLLPTKGSAYPRLLGAMARVARSEERRV